MSPHADAAAGAHASAGAAPLIVHLIHQLDVGGLENGLINLINHLPPERYRHAIVCLKDHTDFARRIERPGVEVISINKREGKDWAHYVRLFKTLKRLQPLLIHTRNLASIEGQLLAVAAGVRLRVHGEHGRDMQDLHGRNLRYRLLRKLLRPLIGHFITVSKDLEAWLVGAIGVRPQQVTHIRNGVDSVRFHPRLGPRAAVGPAGFLSEDAFVIGSVGRMAEVKDYMSLVHAFLLLLAADDTAQEQMRLIIIGDGPCRQACLDVLRRAGVEHLAWLPGSRDDISQLMRAMDVFALPSLAEGTSNTILEAMASGLPVVATAVGGTVDLVRGGWTGTLVPPQAPTLLADAIGAYYRIPGLGAHHGTRGRRRVLAEFSLTAMADAYLAVYDRLT
ncbi:MAG TPA: TIGR03088 family PEP-CTERM/XrtA system glycosyltransferase [Duganella sp.]